LEKLQADLKGVGDLERIASRIAIRKLGPAGSHAIEKISPLAGSHEGTTGKDQAIPD
jgi:hypothetical protein